MILCFLLQSDIVDVNQIFKDLGTMVHEQGEMIGKLAFLKNGVWHRDS